MDNTEFSDDLRRRKRRKKVIKGSEGKKTTIIETKPKKKKKKKKGLFRKIGRGLKKVVKATVGSAALLPLRPFKRAMKRGLKKRGVSTKGMKFKAVVVKFYNEFISKKGKKGSNYEEIREDDFINDVAFYTPLEGFDYETDHAIVAAISTVVSAVIGLFKKSKKKKEAAKKAGMTEAEYKQNISEDERMFAEETERVEKELEEKLKGDKIVKTGDMKKYIIYGVVLAAIGAVVYFVGKKK